jgi:HAE1 family hydrophobic/amphiphilic exporter-1
MSEHANERAQSGIRISTWAIRNPMPVTVLFLALILGGLIAYARLPIKQWPNATFPMVSVSVTQNGAAPEQMETQITRPVEDALAGISNVKTIQSLVTQGMSTTNVEFEMGVDLQQKTDEIRSKVDALRAELPRDIDAPTIMRVEMESAPILTYAVYAPGMSDPELSWFVEDTVARSLQSAKGVAQVTRVGGVSREINVIIDPDRLAARGLTAAQVNNALAAMQTDAPGGRLQLGGREQTLRVVGTVETVRELGQLTIPAAAGRFVRLTDVAEIADGAAEPRGFARLNGRPVVGFQIMKTREASDVTVDDEVKAKLQALAKAHPGVTFTPVFSVVDLTRTSFHATLDVLLEGMLLAAIVVFIFLRDWRATMITALAMPVSLIPTFLVMLALGFSLNLVTLLALTLVIGILVDDAIVEIENIEKRVETGQRPYMAAMQGADAIGLAVVATTMAIVVVFTPVSFLPGVTGQFFREFGLTVSVAVLFSLLVARLLTPLMAAYLLKPKAHPRPRKPLWAPYRRVLGWALDHRIVAAIMGGVIFLLSLMLVPLLPQGFRPTGDPDFMFISVQGPPGATTSDMEATVQEVTRIFQAQPEVRGVFAQIGSNIYGPLGGGSDPRSGTITVLLKEKRGATGDQIRARVHDQVAAIPDARVTMVGPSGMAGFSQVLTGDNPAALQAAAAELEREMRDLTEVTDPRPSTPPVAPEVVIRPRSDEAARLGVSTEAIALAARVATVGDIDANVAKLNEGERRIPIRVRLPQDARADLERIRNLRIPTATGGATTLGSVADVEFQAGPAQITRLNRQRQMTVDAELNGVVIGQAVNAVKKLPIMQHLPDGVRPSSTGDIEEMQSLFANFGMALFAGVMMIMGVLVLLFRSFFKPVVILSALPLAVGGAFAGLLAFRMSLSLPSMIGFLMLLGLAAKNSILLVEYAIERERAGASQRQALIEACSERARPIVMTTVAMAAGMFPAAVALQKGSEFRQPLAIAVIGGLITSTVLSLVLVPVVYEFVDDFERWLRPKLARLITPRDAPPEPQPHPASPP